MMTDTGGDSCVCLLECAQLRTVFVSFYIACIHLVLFPLPESVLVLPSPDTVFDDKYADIPVSPQLWSVQSIQSICSAFEVHFLPYFGLNLRKVLVLRKNGLSKDKKKKAIYRETQERKFIKASGITSCPPEFSCLTRPFR